MKSSVLYNFEILTQNHLWTDISLTTIKPASHCPTDRMKNLAVGEPASGENTYRSYSTIVCHVRLWSDDRR